MNCESRTPVKSKINIDDCGSSGLGSKRSRTENQWFLPDELITMILLCLPADILYNVMRFVCRTWYNIIQSPSFISLHLKRSTLGLLVEQFTDTAKKWYALQPISDHGSAVEARELKFKFVNNIGASCNGLVFVLGPKRRKTQCPCYVANLVTKQQLPLPLIPGKISYGNWYFAYTATSQVYKILYTEYEKEFILTVGVDKEWRKVDISQFSTSFRDILSHPPFYSIISVKGMVYWLVNKEVPFILCFDMERETFRQMIPLPPRCLNIEGFCGVIAMEKSVCLYKEINDFCFDFWLLNDEDGVWEKMPIDFSKVLWSLNVDWIWPIGWLQSGELLVLGAPGKVVIYNVKTGEVHKQEELYSHSHVYHAHVNSLVPMNNLSLVTTNERPCHVRRSREKVYSTENMTAEFEEP